MLEKEVSLIHLRTIRSGCQSIVPIPTACIPVRRRRPAMIASIPATSMSMHPMTMARSEARERHSTGMPHVAEWKFRILQNGNSTGCKMEIQRVAKWKFMWLQNGNACSWKWKKRCCGIEVMAIVDMSPIIDFRSTGRLRNIDGVLIEGAKSCGKT